MCDFFGEKEMLGVSGRVLLLLVTGGMDVKTKSCSIFRLFTRRNFLSKRDRTVEKEKERWREEKAARTRMLFV